MQKLKTLGLVLHMLLGGKCKFSNQKYFVIYNNGSFIIEGSGTLVGNISKLKRHNAK